MGPRLFSLCLPKSTDISRLHLSAAKIGRGDDAVRRDGAVAQGKAGWPAAVVEQALALAQQDGKGEDANLVDQAGSQQGMREFAAALGEKRRSVLLFQVCDTAFAIVERDRGFPAEIGAFAGRDIFGDLVELPGNGVMWPALVAGPVGGKDVIGAPAQQQVI